MRNVRRVLRIALFLIVGLYLHYIMPQQDVARVTLVDSRLQNVTGWQAMFYAQEDAGTAVSSAGRDLRLISTERVPTYLLGAIRSGRGTMVYRNEDTGWIYPPYFKFDSADLQAEAAASISTSEPYEWVIIRHYGWRIRWASIYPNAVSIRPAAGPDVHPIPWINMVIFAVLIVGLLFVRAAWLQFRERTLDPLADKAGDRIDHVSADMSERKGRISRWLGTWREKK